LLGCWATEKAKFRLILTINSELLIQRIFGDKNHLAKFVARSMNFGHHPTETRKQIEQNELRKCPMNVQIVALNKALERHPSL
jgi:hypothetical protein